MSYTSLDFARQFSLDLRQDSLEVVKHSHHNVPLPPRRMHDNDQKLSAWCTQCSQTTLRCWVSGRPKSNRPNHSAAGRR